MAAPSGDPGPPLSAEAARLVTDAFGAAVVRVVEALGWVSSGGGPGQDSAAPPATTLRRLPRAGIDAGVEAGKQAARAPTTAASRLLDILAGEVIPAVVRRLDLNAIIDRVDVQRVVDRIDVQAVVQKVDVGAVVEKVDVEEVLARVDVNELVARVDIGPVAKEAIDAVDMGQIVRESTTSLGTEASEAARVQAMWADDALANVVDRLLRRREPRQTGLDARAGG
jgi:hypothetical protein